jgi:hypothetical protein
MDFETIKHMLGLCGEGHPSLLWLLASGSAIIYWLKHNIKYCWKQGCDMCKSKLLKLKKVNKN